MLHAGWALEQLHRSAPSVAWMRYRGAGLYGAPHRGCAMANIMGGLAKHFPCLVTVEGPRDF
jgi:hypothetical protein